MNAARVKRVSKRSPGPWQIVKCQCGHPVCHTYGISVGTFYQGCGFDLADAQLVAAAPDLLEALKGLLPRGWGHPDGHMDHMPGIKAARLAIAKAEGRS